VDILSLSPSLVAIPLLFFFNVPAPAEIYTLSLHDALPIFDRQARVAALQFAGAIVLNAVREDQILGASGRPHRVSLDKTQTRNGPRQAGSFEKAARDRVAAKLPETGGFERAHAWRPVGQGSLP